MLNIERLRRRANGRAQAGFSLLELVAVMAILAILVAIVMPSATNMQQASVRSQVQGDSQQVRNAAADFFKDQQESEVRTPHSVTVTAADDGVAGSLSSTQQVVSSKWPEVFITEDTATVPDLTGTRSQNARYSDVFPTSTSDTHGVVVKVAMETENGRLSVDGDGGLLDDYTAIDLETLIDEGYLADRPEAEDRKGDAGVLLDREDLEVPNFLWLFKKEGSSGGQNDMRQVAVFQLANLELAGGGQATGVHLAYEQIVGKGSGSPTEERLSVAKAVYDGDDYIRDEDPTTTGSWDGQEFTSAMLDDISSSDDGRAQTQATSSGAAAQHVFGSDVGGTSAQSIASFTLQWEGFLANADSTDANREPRLEVWNHAAGDSGAWEDTGLAVPTTQTDETPLSKKFTTSISDYIISSDAGSGPFGNGFIVFQVSGRQTRGKDVPDQQAKVHTDYAALLLAES